MKIKMIIPMTLVLCLTFSLCACGTTANTNETTTVPATTTASVEETTAVPETTEAFADVETTAAEAETDTNDTTFTHDDALELVKNTYEPSGNTYYRPRGTFEVDGVTYFAVDLMKSLETNSTYEGLTYFVTTDGSEIVKGYIENDEAIFTTGDEKPDFEVTEENAVDIVNAAFDFDENCFLTFRGTEEIDGTTYYVVDLRKSLETNTTYLASYFVKADGTQIVDGYYEGGTPVLAE